jgi:hypothetical protein
MEVQSKEQVIGDKVPQQSEETQHAFWRPSTYLIKNKTGELILFMASKKQPYTELHPNVELPLDFHRYVPDEIRPPNDFNDTLSSN